MREFVARLLYLAVVLGLYLLGARLTQPTQKALSPEINLAILLPLFSLVFLEYYIRALSFAFYRLCLEQTQTVSDNLILTLRLVHRGAQAGYYEYDGIDGLQARQLQLAYSHSNEPPKTNVVPEEFQVCLTSDSPAAHITLTAVRPKLTGPSFTYRRANQRFRIGLVSIRIRSSSNIALRNWFIIRLPANSP